MKCLFYVAIDYVVYMSTRIKTCARYSNNNSKTKLRKNHAIFTDKAKIDPRGGLPTIIKFSGSLIT